MKWIFPVTVIFMALFSSSAHADERRYLMGSFDDIVIDGDMQVIIETGKPPSAWASGDRNMLDSLKLVRIGKIITVRMQDVINNDNGRVITEPLVITLTNRHVRNITLRGNARLRVDEINQPYGSTILLNGSGEIDVAKMTVDKLAVTLFGNGRLSIKDGNAEDSRVEIRGSAQYLAAGLRTETLKLTHDGNANSHAFVAEKAEISNQGSGSIIIDGKGQCFIRKAGMAVIKCRQTK